MHKSHKSPSVLFLLLALLAPAAPAQITISTASQNLTDRGVIPSKADPGSPATGELWLSTTDANRLKFRSGSTTFSIATLTDVSTGYQPLDTGLTSLAGLAGETTTTFTFSSSGDTTGVVYYLGTQSYYATFANPHTATTVTAVMKTEGNGTAANLVDRANQEVNTNNEDNSWIALDLGSGRTLVPTKYSMRHGTATPSFLRNWKLQGSNNAASNSVAHLEAATWADLDIRVNDTTIDGASYAWGSFDVTGITTGYRWLRILQTGNNSSGNSVLRISEFEFYGTLTATPTWSSGIVAFNSATDAYGTFSTSSSLRALMGDETGTGALVFAGGNIGAATATSINKVVITAPATGATITIVDGKTFTSSNTLTLAGTDGSTLNFGTGGTLGTAAYTAATAYEVPLTFSTGLTRTTNTVTVNTTQNITNLSNLTSNGLVKTTGGDGTLGTATADTDYQTPQTTAAGYGITGGAALDALGAVATDGLLARTAANTYVARSVAGTAPISVTNGDGVAGNPTVSVSAASTSAAGVVELATTTESLAGTDTVRAPSVSSQEARILYGSIDRDNAPNLFCDGATSNRRGEATFGTAGAIAGMAATFPFVFDVPTSNPSVTLYAFTFTSSTSAPVVDYSLRFSVFTNGGLYLTQEGSPTASNKRELAYVNFRTTYSGLRVRGMVVFESGNTTSNPKIYINGVDISASFTLSAPGSPANWMPTTLDTTKFLSGYNWTSGRFVPYAPILGALTAAEVLAWTQTGRLPTWCEIGTGSTVAAYTSTFASGVDSWAGSGAGQTITGNIDTDADGAGVPPSDNWARVARTSTTGALGFYRSTAASQWLAGGAYRATFDIFVPTGSTIGYVRLLGYNGAAANYTNYGIHPVTAGAVTSISESVKPSRLEVPTLVVCDVAGNQRTDITTGVNLYLKNYLQYVLGPLAKWEIQPTDSALGGVIARDVGTNNIHLVGTPGITPITNSNRGVISATLTWSGTHEAKSIAGQASLPGNARVDYILTKATVASSGAGLTVGSTTTPALFVAANTYTTAKEDHTLAARLPAGTATNDLNLVVDPDDANYTGSITVTIGYTTSISTP